MPDHSGLSIFLTQGQFLLHMDHRIGLDPEDEEALGLVNLLKELVVCSVVAVSHVSLARHAHLA